MRNSWIKDLPKDVCYLYLYDNLTDIPEEEKFDGISLNSSYHGREVRYAEKLYKLYSYVNNSEILDNIKYVAKMDDDVILCPKKLFDFLNGRHINIKSYAGWFYHPQPYGNHISFKTRADGMFVLLGRVLMDRII